MQSNIEFVHFVEGLSRQVLREKSQHSYSLPGFGNNSFVLIWLANDYLQSNMIPRYPYSGTFFTGTSLKIWVGDLLDFSFWRRSLQLPT